ncbi:MAG: gamma-glutamylcyclotransferase [Oscillospiraceae bacterium]
MTERCERNLDRYEGYPGFYKKTEIPVELEAGTQTAMVYVMNDAAKGKFRLPVEYYYYGIQDGYEDNGLPLDYLEKALEECKVEVVKGGNCNG